MWTQGELRGINLSSIHSDVFFLSFNDDFDDDVNNNDDGTIGLEDQAGIILPNPLQTSLQTSLPSRLDHLPVLQSRLFRGDIKIFIFIYKAACVCVCMMCVTVSHKNVSHKLLGTPSKKKLHIFRQCLN